MLMKTNLKLSYYESERSSSYPQKKELGPLLGPQMPLLKGPSRLVGELATPAVVGEDAAKFNEKIASEISDEVNQLQKEHEKVKQSADPRNYVEKQSNIKAHAVLNSKMQQSSYGSLVKKSSTSLKPTPLSPMDQFQNFQTMPFRFRNSLPGCQSTVIRKVYCFMSLQAGWQN